MNWSNRQLKAMTSGHVFIAISLDGFIARGNHEIDWLTELDTGNDDFGYGKFIETVDGIVMGRRTYEKVLTLGDWQYSKPVIVMSKSMSQEDVHPELADKVSMTNLDPCEIMDVLQAKGWNRVYVDGGQVVQAFLQAGLIQDMVLTVAPVLIGDGIRLFGSVDEDVNLELVDVRQFASGMVQAQYRIVKEHPSSTIGDDQARMTLPGL